jgi:hypothetical protein
VHCSAAYRTVVPITGSLIFVVGLGGGDEDVHERSCGLTLVNVYVVSPRSTSGSSAVP